MKANVLAAFVVMATVTYFTRAFFTVYVSRIQVTPFWSDVLASIPLAALAALIAPLVFFESGTVHLWNPYLVAGALTFLISVKTKNMIISAAIGLIVFFAIQGRM